MCAEAAAGQGKVAPTFGASGGSTLKKTTDQGFVSTAKPANVKSAVDEPPSPDARKTKPETQTMPSSPLRSGSKDGDTSSKPNANMSWDTKVGGTGTTLQIDVLAKVRPDN